MGNLTNCEVFLKLIKSKDTRELFLNNFIFTHKNFTTLTLEKSHLMKDNNIFDFDEYKHLFNEYIYLKKYLEMSLGLLRLKKAEIKNEIANLRKIRKLKIKGLGKHIQDDYEERFFRKFEKIKEEFLSLMLSNRDLVFFFDIYSNVDFNSLSYHEILKRGSFKKLTQLIGNQYVLRFSNAVKETMIHVHCKFMELLKKTIHYRSKSKGFIYIFILWFMK